MFVMIGMVRLLSAGLLGGLACRNAVAQRKSQATAHFFQNYKKRQHDSTQMHWRLPFSAFLLVKCDECIHGISYL